MALSPLTRFLRFYVVKAGILDGAAGFAHVAIGAFASYLGTRSCATSGAPRLRQRRPSTTMSESMRVLVTGAAGFIGMHVSQRLLDTGAEVDQHRQLR